jgi:hypothetical protein
MKKVEPENRFHLQELDRQRRQPDQPVDDGTMDQTQTRTATFAAQ